MTDWRLPENRREAFMRLYLFHLRYKSHPGCVYSLLPAIADHFHLDPDGRAWLVWLNGNTQNPATSWLLLSEAPTAEDWPKAVRFWNENFTKLEWDIDRRHQKSKFGEATEKWARGLTSPPSDQWYAAADNWKNTWDHAVGQPYMGRLSAWSMTEYARILLGTVIPDADSLMLHDANGSRSHRNGLAVVAGYQGAEYWTPAQSREAVPVEELAELGEDLLQEAKSRHPHPDTCRLTLESALCTYKSMHKPNRRYPNVYADMTYNRLRKAESRFGDQFSVLWAARERDLPPALRMEDQPLDPGLTPVKQNHYRETGEVVMAGHDWPDMWSSFDENVALGLYGPRKEKF